MNLALVNEKISNILETPKTKAMLNLTEKALSRQQNIIQEVAEKAFKYQEEQLGKYFAPLLSNQQLQIGLIH